MVFAGQSYGSIGSSTSALMESVQAQIEKGRLYPDNELYTFTEMANEAIQTNSSEWTGIMESIGIAEVMSLAESGQEMVYEAADIASVAESIKNFLLGILKKILSIAEAAIAKFTSWVRDDKKWFDSYKVKIQKGIDAAPSGFKFKGYKFENLDGAKEPSTDGVVSDIMGFKDIAKNGGEAGEGFGDAYKDDARKDTIADYQATLVPGFKSGDDFRKKLHEYLYGSEKKVDLTISDVSFSGLQDVITSTKKTIDEVKKSRDNIKKSIGKSIEEVNKAAKHVKDAEKKVKDADSSKNNDALASGLVAMGSVLKEIQNINTSWFGAKISALKDRNRQSKAVGVKMVMYSGGAWKDNKSSSSSKKPEEGEGTAPEGGETPKTESAGMFGFAIV